MNKYENKQRIKNESLNKILAIVNNYNYGVIGEDDYFQEKYLDIVSVIEDMEKQINNLNKKKEN